jgi:hypothetical protein
VSSQEKAIYQISNIFIHKALWKKVWKGKDGKTEKNNTLKI